jgi:hypothetical protein
MLIVNVKYSITERNFLFVLDMLTPINSLTVNSKRRNKASGLRSTVSELRARNSHSPSNSADIFNQLALYFPKDVVNIITSLNDTFRGETEELKLDNRVGVHCTENGNMVFNSEEELLFYDKDYNFINSYVFGKQLYNIYPIKKDLAIVHEEEIGYSYEIFNTTTGEKITKGKVLCNPGDLSHRYNPIMSDIVYGDNQTVFPFHSGWLSYDNFGFEIYLVNIPHLVEIQKIKGELKTFIQPKRYDKIIYYISREQKHDTHYDKWNGIEAGYYQLVSYNIATKKHIIKPLKFIPLKGNKMSGFLAGGKIVLFVYNNTIIVIDPNNVRNNIIKNITYSLSIKLLDDFGDSAIFLINHRKSSFLYKLDLNNGTLTKLRQVEGEYLFTNEDGYAFRYYGVITFYK